MTVQKPLSLSPKTRLSFSLLLMSACPSALAAPAFELTEISMSVVLALLLMILAFTMWQNKRHHNRLQQQIARHTRQLQSFATQQADSNFYFQALAGVLIQRTGAHLALLIPTPAAPNGSLNIQQVWRNSEAIRLQGNEITPALVEGLTKASTLDELYIPRKAHKHPELGHFMSERRMGALYAMVVRNQAGVVIAYFLLLAPKRLVLSRDQKAQVRSVCTSLSSALQHRPLRANEDFFTPPVSPALTPATLIKALPQAIVCTNQSGVIEYINPAAENLLELYQWHKQPVVLSSILKPQETRGLNITPSPYTPQTKQSMLAIEDYVLQLPGRNERAIKAHVTPYQANANAPKLSLLTLEDITSAKQYMAEIVYEATHDSLTGLENRRQFLRRLEQALEGAKQYANQHALCYIDLDHFKAVNDTAGHLAGDALLKQVASIISDGLRARDTLARMGGDEFALILYNCPTEKALEIAQKITLNVSQLQFTWDEKRFPISVSIGIANIQGNTNSLLRLLEQADSACYQAKQEQRGTVRCANHTQQRGNSRNLMANLQKAISNNQFRLYAQPIKCIKPVKSLGPSPPVQHYEILLRMVDLEGRMVEPSKFVPEAERQGLMGEIDRWVIHYALEAIAELSSDAGGRCFEFGINLSGSSMGDEGLLNFVQEELSRHRLSHAKICFEITETAAIHNMVNARHFIEQLRRLGCSFALDDFGSGMCSLRYLQQLPVDYLKIDGSFIREIHTNPTDRKLTAAIHQIGKVMHMKTIAEFVENSQILKELKHLGVDYAQGSLMGNAIPLNDLSAELPHYANTPQ